MSPAISVYSACSPLMFIRVVMWQQASFVIVLAAVKNLMKLNQVATGSSKQNTCAIFHQYLNLKRLGGTSKWQFPLAMLIPRLGFFHLMRKWDGDGFYSLHPVLSRRSPNYIH
ncbi:hypothetical protein CsSME_00018964 [Camellia sinensis var. sinensis]